jgi:hypothetical protein
MEDGGESIAISNALSTQASNSIDTSKISLFKNETEASVP